jgi:exonuclease SbcD
MGENCYYSGSPLQYSFDEVADKSVKVFDLDEKGVQNLKDIPLTKGKKLIRLTASEVDTAENLLNAYPDALIELTLMLKQPLTANDSKRLALHDNLVSLRAELTATTTARMQSRKNMTDEELFTAFYKTQYAAEPKEELKTLFLTTINELQER